MCFLLAVLATPGCSKQGQAEVEKLTVEPVPENVGTAVGTPLGERPEETANAAGKRMTTSPQLPFSMWASRRGEVTPGAVLPLVFTLQSGLRADSITTTVRALKGVVVSGSLVKQHAAPKAGAKLQHRVLVRADKGVAGYVVIDIAWRGPDGDGSTTEGVEIRAQGAEQKLEKLGRIERGENGQPIEVMKAEMR